METKNNSQKKEKLKPKRTGDSIAINEDDELRTNL